MNFFINEIIDNEEIKNILLNENSYINEAKCIAKLIKTGGTPVLENGILPIFVLGFLANFALEKNLKRGISKDITVDTLKDVNIWINNYQVQYGKIGLAEFDWLKNHYTGDLFKLGRLQFRIEKNLFGAPSGDYVIETHIPQGEPLEINECLFSFKLARKFFSEFFSDKKADYFFCDSWLLNPNLNLILSNNSNIVKFMNLWTKTEFPSDNSAQAIERVFGFGFKKENIKMAAENTILQRELKKFLLSGNDMNITAGYINISSLGLR